MKTRGLLLNGLIVLVLAQLLYGMLILSALYKQYMEPASLVQALICRDAAEHLGFVLKAGKRLLPTTAARFVETYGNRSLADTAAIADSTGNILFSQGLAVPEGRMPADAKEVLEGVRMHSSEGRTWLSSPVADASGKQAAVFFLGLRESAGHDAVLRAIRPHCATFALVTAGECLLLAVLLALSKGRHAGTLLHAGGARRAFHFSESTRLRICTMLPLILGQACFLFLLHGPLLDLYGKSLHDEGMQLARQTAWDLERLSGLGLPVSEVPPLGEWLSERQTGLNSLAVAVYDENGRLKGAATKNSVLDEAGWKQASEGAVLARTHIINPVDNDFAGMVCAAMNPLAASSGARSVMLDGLTLAFLTAIFLSELLHFLAMKTSGPAGPGPKCMRPVIFAGMFAIDLSSSYVPLRTFEFGSGLFGLPADIVAGLPVSFELAAAGAAMFIGGWWSQKHGWRSMLLCGAAAACIGSAASWAASSPLPFIIARGVAGLGYGFINLAAQVHVVAHTSERDRAQGLAFMFAGLYAGSLCGSSMGGLVADRLGYGAVFAVSAAMLAFLLMTFMKILPHETWREQAAPKGKTGYGSTLRLLGDRKMGGFLLCLVIPNALATVCLFQYFIPLSLSSSGSSPADIGRIFLLYCSVVIFAGPAIGRMIDRTRTPERHLAAALPITVLGILMLFLLDGLPAAAACMLLLAVNTAVASNGQGAYAISIPAARAFGRLRTMGMYNVAMRAGQVLGPLVLGLMTTAWGTAAGLGAVAVFLCACTAGFVLTNCRCGRRDG